MEKIVIKKQGAPSRVRRAAVAVKPEIYKRISDIAFEAGLPIETVTNMMLEEALKNVVVE